MASESTDPGDVTVTLPAELREWLDTHAAERDVDRDELLRQLLETYRRTADGDTPDPAEAAVDRETIEHVVREVLAERREEIVAAVTAEIEPDEETDGLAERVDKLEANFQEKLGDVRKRVIQVKREADAKAPVDHHHDAFDRLDGIDERLDELAGDVAALEAEIETLAAESALEELEANIDEYAETLAEREERLADLENKLRTVGWAVSDLREEQAGRGTDTLDRIKAAAAGHDVSRAVCENCGDAVELALMTRPACPHCEAAVTNVEPASGFFGKPTLVTASQIESGTDETDPDRDVSVSRSERQ
ncbi:Asp23/Gls24 family envelope stress response protein [Halorhabdus amylolytica]|uniref:hypothetical protein n=1 Tax=Halorhabdus amylolytica TaxID=2559573 RepID=UPI0010AB45FE|nr:hypothetical protein [Halorhabdus amylolytica]